MHDEEDKSVSAIDLLFSALGNFSRAGAKKNSRGPAPRAGSGVTFGRANISTAAPVPRGSCCIAKRPGQK